MKSFKLFRELGNVSGVFVCGNEILITGCPNEEDELHNCDAMGCNAVEHILLRGCFQLLEKGYDPEKQEAQEHE